MPNYQYIFIPDPCRSPSPTLDVTAAPALDATAPALDATAPTGEDDTTPRDMEEEEEGEGDVAAAEQVVKDTPPEPAKKKLKRGRLTLRGPAAPRAGDAPRSARGDLEQDLLSLHR